jgi:metallo-beta-lactamase family protein
MKIKFCGAARNVTGSNHLLDINGKKILLDCGLFQGGGRAKAKLKNQELLYDPKDVDYVLLSHAHIDHAGRIPLLVKRGFTGQIFCTKATKELANVLLQDSAYIQMQDAFYINKKFKGETIEPLYTNEDVEKAITLFKSHEYTQKFKLDEGIWVTFYDAGHVLGSAIVVIDYKEDNEYKRLTFTGDLGQKYVPIVNDPYQVKESDTLITESTYASHLHDDFSTVHDDLAMLVNDVVARKGKIIVPGFSFERTQEFVYVLHELIDQKRIPQIPIFVDSPLSTEISKVFDKFKDYYDEETFRTFVDKKKSPFYFEGIKYIKKVEESKRLNQLKGSCIIISASGMCEAGRIKHHLKNHMSNQNNLILVIGFMARGTRGRLIVEGRRTIKIFGQNYPLKADVVIMNSFSAHADKLELLDYVKNIENLKNIFVVHGEETECAVMRDNIYNVLKFKGRVEVPIQGEEYEVKGENVRSKIGKRKDKIMGEFDESERVRKIKDKK